MLRALGCVLCCHFQIRRTKTIPVCVLRFSNFQDKDSAFELMTPQEMPLFSLRPHPEIRVTLFFSFFKKIEFIGVTLMNKTIQVSGVQLCNTSAAQCIVYSASKVKSVSCHHLSPCCPLAPPSSPFPSGNHHSVVSVCFFLIPSPLSPGTPTSLLSDSCQSIWCIYESVSILFASLFCSLDSTDKWNHMYLALWLTLLSIILSRSIHTVAQGKNKKSNWPSVLLAVREKNTKKLSKRQMCVHGILFWFWGQFVSRVKMGIGGRMLSDAQDWYSPRQALSVYRLKKM